MALQINSNVDIKYTLLNGVVKGATIDNETLEVQYLIEFTDNFGELQHRYFLESQLAV